jgi:hypothetical protein
MLTILPSVYLNGNVILLFRLKASAVLAVCYCVLGILGLISVGALLVLCCKSCERPTCNLATNIRML